MALSEVEIERLAGMGNKLRPEWPAKSLKTWITNNLTNRSYQDAAIALAAAATDESVSTPAALLNAGHWWVAAGASFQAQRTKSTTLPTARTQEVPRVGPEPGADRCPVYGHWAESAQWCRLCAADRAAAEATSHPVDEDGPICNTEHPRMPGVRCVVTLTSAHRSHRSVARVSGHREIVSWRDPEPEPDEDGVETPQEEVSAP